MKTTTKCLLLALVLCRILTMSYAFAQDEEMIFPTDNESNMSAPGASSPPPVMIDQSDSSDVSDVEEYDG